MCSDNPVDLGVGHRHKFFIREVFPVQRALDPMLRRSSLVTLQTLLAEEFRAAHVLAVVVRLGCFALHSFDTPESTNLVERIRIRLPPYNPATASAAFMLISPSLCACCIPTTYFSRSSIFPFILTLYFTTQMLVKK